MYPSVLLRRKHPPRWMLTRASTRAWSSSDAPEIPRKHIAIIGSGPAGFYTAGRLFKARKSDQLCIDIYESFPVPYGLLRFGVAPDHAEVKNAALKFQAVAQNPACRFVGNIHVGRDVQVGDLQRHYHAVVFAYGAEGDRLLNVPGEHLDNVLSARAFVGWYNGHPHHRHLAPDLAHSDTAVIVGQGNVALDVARMLLTPHDKLRKTDMTSYALERLRHSRIRHVHLVGRRGPLQVAFTVNELRELTSLPDCRPHIDLDEVNEGLQAYPEIWQGVRAKSRLMQAIRAAAERGQSMPENTSKSWHLRFLQSPTLISSDSAGSTAVSRIVFEKNRLQYCDTDEGMGRINGARAIPTRRFEELACGLVFRSIGYQSVRLPGVPFDEHRHVIPNDRGRVLDASHRQLSGLYAAGWVKRGPVGVLAHTMMDAHETADAVLSDLRADDTRTRGERERHGFAGVYEEVMRPRGLRSVSFVDWLRIEEEEKRRGQELGKEQEKLVVVDDMLSLLEKRDEKQQFA